MRWPAAESNGTAMGLMVGLALPMLVMANFGDEEPRGGRRV